MSGLAVRTTDPATSALAAEHAPNPRLRDMVWDVLSASRGLTDDELADRLHPADPRSVGKRRGELAAEGLVRDSGRTRPTKRGRSAIVWEAVR